MSVFGWLVALAGVAALLFSLTMETSVRTRGAWIGGQYIGGGDVHNLDLANRKQNAVIVSGLATLVGVIFIAAGYSQRRD
jgi:hypothetical protein